MVDTSFMDAVVFPEHVSKGSVGGPDWPAEIVTLRPMSLGALYRLIESRTGVRLNRPALVRLERASGGVPLFALDIVRAARRSGTSITPAEILPVGVEVGPADFVCSRIFIHS